MIKTASYVLMTPGNFLNKVFLIFKKSIFKKKEEKL